MSFILRKLKHRPWPVTVKLLDANEAGEVSENEFTFVLHFKPFTEAEFKAALDALNDEKAPAAAGEQAPAADAEKPVDRPIAATLEKNSQLFAQLVDGWNKVLDEAGQPVPYSPDALRALVIGPDGMAVSTGIHRALTELRFGLAPAKNLPTSAAPGPSPAAAEVATNSPATSATSA